MMQTDIKVSVVIPVYNAYDYLRPAIDSVIDQSLREIEIICVDDGSSDGSAKLLREYAYIDRRIRVVEHGMNAGVSTARNKGIIRASGEYIIFLDADDFYEPNLLETLYERAKEDNLDIAIASFDYYNNKRSRFLHATEEPHSSIYAGGAVVSHSEYPDYIFESTSGYVWNKLFRTEFIKDKGLMFPAELSVFEDTCFVYCALALAERVGREEEIMVHHRIYSDQSRAKLYRKTYSAIPEVYLKVKNFLSRHGMYVPLARSFINTSTRHCYKVYNLLWSDEREAFWEMLHEGMADSLGWFAQENDDFETQELADFAANVGLYTYSQYMSRRDTGRLTDTKRWSPARLYRRIQGTRFWERIAAGFKKKTEEK